MTLHHIKHKPIGSMLLHSSKNLGRLPACTTDEDDCNKVEDCEPDPVNHPHRSIHVEMERIIHSHWWKELNPSGRLSMGTHLLREGLGNAEALQ